MQSLKLKLNKGFSWFCNGTISVKGYFFDSKNNYYEKQNLITYFQDVANETDFVNKIKQANGIFSVVLKIEGFIYLASDSTRMFPLFYSFENEKLLISDDISFLKNKISDIKFNNQSIAEFKAAAHTLGSDTLLKNIYQLQSSEYIIFKEDRIKKKAFFFSYSIEQISNFPYSELKKQAIQSFENAFERLIISLKKQPVAIPLSGGFDSRLIALMFKKYNYKNVICFTYGRKNNFELENSKAVAKKLGFKWIFVEYNNQLIHNYINTSEFNKYAHFAGKYSSMPYLQEYFAVKYLKENKLIPDNSIFIPGHSGDLLGGSQLVKVVPKNLKREEISSLILKNKFSYYQIPVEEKQNAEKKINKTLENFNLTKNRNLAYSVFEDYDIKEKIAKFIFNSSNIFLYYDYEIRFPFWDIELLNFFKRVPFQYKEMKLLYDNILVSHYFKMFDINFQEEIQPTKFDLYKQKIKTKIKPYLPTFVRKKLMYKADWMMYKEITDQMKNQLLEKGININPKINFYNSIIIQWYIQFCKEII